MRRIPIRSAFLTLILTLAQGSAPSLAQQPFPFKPVRMISPYAPGGGNDVLCRIVANRLTEGLRQQVIVENRPGANAIVAQGYPSKPLRLLTTGAGGSTDFVTRTAVQVLAAGAG